MRKERDSMGEMSVPEDSLYGASTQRAVLNFPISGHKMPERFIRCMGLLKYACAKANEDLGKLSKAKSEWIQKAALEVFNGEHNDQFPIDIFQTGSCTSSNMNVNEVIAHRVKQLGAKEAIHPNDDVNKGQSSNDTMPTVLHISVALALKEKLEPALAHLASELAKKADSWKDIVKIGRTHLMDATPVTMGQQFSGYAVQARKGVDRIQKAIQALCELAIGGTAVGTGINCYPGFTARVIEVIRNETGIDFKEADNHFEAQAGRDDCVEVAGQLNVIAASLTKIANDIRLMGSGPRSGLGELIVPATQPGSSIMPGKVNPVMSEMLVQVCLYVQGLCNTVVMCGRDGHFELNVTIPLIAYALHESIECLGNACRVFADKCVQGLKVDQDRCNELLERSLMLVTALNPHIGYDKAAYVAKKAYEENKTLKEILLAEGMLDEASIERALDPKTMIEMKDEEKE
ncbi:MAG: aspartate ammonia-lyase [Verrucomicrobia bacterium CG_4_10_14_3_um_filter_43_23]|nr:MAG: aspartate ammonia-lyase [Verrucomicrobia bacterium CG1_02_43_26]PIP59075.1 MAG: aspartate ammonia-lyase [Verrucomicrobia bacterium CG22_combo_CG10-13_8_21_14_all_43_17]PIX59172.1 MAG: aspartate ammonia-lyase [Verrucomicrobia bacterium CG_4_10_14_3_um_filter_43_23]PIY61303.1 MAG: aspartate ammonia-lyase [Verrucomicrobia bacterium CG_4_10_14_0_8_um_filter_43_34]PJA44085.1 MAG: aspartate ammonia-lyase [Verrucomicrobia bacterium CG_4_9_14_3_um_filter_43_20]